MVKVSRYAVKGLSEELLPEITLSVGQGVPGDRTYALALSSTVFDDAHPLPLPKTSFAVLMRYAGLASLSSKYDHDTTMLELHRADGWHAAGRLATPEGRGIIESAIAEHLKGDLKGIPRMVQAEGHRFTDISVVSAEMMEAVSLISLPSVRDFALKIGKNVDARRFRANFLVDGWDAWQEFDLIGKEIWIGDVKFKVATRTKRCAATEVNPDTAERDIRLPVELLKKFGHGDMGVYLTVETDGIVRTGDVVRI